MSGLPQSGIDYELAHIDQSQQAAAYAVVSIFFALAIGSVTLRLWSIKIGNQKFGYDDAFVCISMFAGIGLMAVTMGEVVNGIGRHLLSIKPEQLKKQMKYAFANLYFYATCITFAKLSVLALITKTFGSQNRKLRIAVYIIAGYMVSWLVALYFAFSFQCRPIQRNWSLTEPCAPSLELEYSATALNTVSDLAVLILPQPVIWGLKMQTKKKAVISLIFLIGFVATLMGVLRMAYVKGAPGSKHKADATYAVGPALIFNAGEPFLAIVCACLPSFPRVYRHLHIESFSSLGSSLLRSFRSSSRRSLSKKSTSSTPSDTSLKMEPMSKNSISVQTDVSIRGQPRNPDDHSSSFDSRLEQYGKEWP